MNDINDMSDTIAPKSDQLNSDDLIAGPITVKITGVTRGTAEQPIDVHIDGHQPFRPCKSMRRVMVAAWGKKGSDWIDKWVTLFCDPTVTFGGVALGGIRISHMSDINGPLSMMLTTTRSKRKSFTVQPLAPQAPEHYPDDMFDKNLQAWSELVESGKMSAAQIIEKAGQRAPLTEEQAATVKALEVTQAALTSTSNH